MNILIIEDNEYKLNNIKESLHNTYKISRIVTFKSLNESLLFIKNNHDYIDLLILDWCFPRYENESPIIGLGSEVLNYINKHNYLIDIIICSSDIVDIKDDNVKKIILYEGSSNINFTLNKQIVKKIDKK